MGATAFGRYDERGDPILNLKPAAGKAVERRALGKVQRPTFPRAWKSRKVRGIPTFPPPRRRLRETNETGHFTCYKNGHLTC